MSVQDSSTGDATPMRTDATTHGHGAEAQTPHRPRYGQPFWPGAVFGSSIFVTATAIALIALSLIHPAELQNPADPLNHPDPTTHVPYNPRPEWYFLFLFQVLKIFGGPLELIGTMGVPAVLGIVLLALPFYDRNWSRRAVRRPIAMASGSLIIIALVYLTYIPIVPTTSNAQVLTTVAAAPKFSNVEAIFQNNCQGCHVGVSSYLAGLNLSDYQGVVAGGNGGGIAGIPHKILVPGNAKASFLWQVLEGKIGPNQGAAMPLGRAKLPAVDRQNIYNWIQNGAKND